MSTSKMAAEPKDRLAELLEKHRGDIQSICGVTNDSNIQSLAKTLDGNVKSTLVEYQKRPENKVIKRVNKHVDFVRGWKDVISAFVQSDPAISALVWGSVLAVLVMLDRETGRMEKIGPFLDEVEKQIEILNRYLALYPTNENLKECHCSVLDEYVSFMLACAKRCKRSTMRNIFSQSFERRFDEFESNLERLLKQFKREATVTGHETLNRNFLSSQPINRLAQETPDVDGVLLDTLRMPRNDVFHGRNALLEQIHSSLTPGTSSSIKKCVLSGLGGCGKTQTANEYAHRYKSAYKYIFWIDAEVESRLIQDFVDVIQSLPEITPDTGDKANVKKVRDWLSRAREPWLLILDNVVDHDMVSNYVPLSRTCKGAVIITTQSSAKPRSLHSLTVDTFNEGEGSESLIKYLGTHFDFGNNSEVEKIRSEAREISSLVGGLPLALVQAAGYILQSKASMGEFIETYKNRQISPIIWNAKDDYGKSLETVFDMALGALEAADPNARDLLDVIAFFNPDQISEDMVFKEHSSPCLAQFSITDHARIDEMRASLTDRHQLERKKGADSGYVLRMHRSLKQSLIQRLERGSSRSHRLQLAYEQAFCILREATPKHSSTSAPIKMQDMPAFARVFPHITAFMSIKQTLSDSRSMPTQNPMDLARLLLDVGHYMYETQALDGGLDIIHHAKEISDSQPHNSDDENCKLQIQWLIASHKLNHGIDQRQEGIDLMRQILDRRYQLATGVEKRPPGGYSQLATAYNNLACAHMHEFDFGAAERLLEHSLDIRRQLGDEQKSPGGFGEYKKNKALIVASRGDFTQALALADESIPLLTMAKERGTAGRMLLLGRFLRACLRFESGDIAGSLPEHLEVLEQRREALGDHHDHTIDSSFMVGRVYLKMNEMDEAEKYLKSCLDKRSSYYETRIPRILFRLSQVLNSKGENQEAEILLQEAHGMKEKLLSQPEKDMLKEAQVDDVAIYEWMASLWSGRPTSLTVQAPTHSEEKAKIARKSSRTQPTYHIMSTSQARVRSWLEDVLAETQDDTRTQPWKQMFEAGTVNCHGIRTSDEGVYSGQMMEDNGGADNDDDTDAGGTSVSVSDIRSEFESIKSDMISAFGRSVAQSTSGRK